MTTMSAERALATLEELWTHPRAPLLDNEEHTWLCATWESGTREAVQAVLARHGKVLRCPTTPEHLQPDDEPLDGCGWEDVGPCDHEGRFVCPQCGLGFWLNGMDPLEEERGGAHGPGWGLGEGLLAGGLAPWAPSPWAVRQWLACQADYAAQSDDGALESPPMPPTGGPDETLIVPPPSPGGSLVLSRKAVLPLALVLALAAAAVWLPGVLVGAMWPHLFSSGSTATTSLASHCAASLTLPDGASSPDFTTLASFNTPGSFGCTGNVNYADGTTGIVSVETCANAGDSRCTKLASVSAWSAPAGYVGDTASVTHLGGSRAMVTWSSNGSTCIVYVFEMVGNDAVVAMDSGNDYDCSAEVQEATDVEGAVAAQLGSGTVAW